MLTTMLGWYHSFGAVSCQRMLQIFVERMNKELILEEKKNKFGYKNGIETKNAYK